VDGVQPVPSASNPARSSPFGSSAPAIAGAALALVLIALVMIAKPAAGYLWIKAAHVIAVIAWMAGMLYLPRLFVYHCAAAPDSAQSETFKLMEFRLLKFIINPAMMATWIFGLWLAWDAGFFRSGWLHAKLALVIALSGLHGYLSAALRAFAEDRNRRSARHWRIMNEVPAVLMAAIVVLVIVKPF
jgi:protoporphyrinogen IX oxidase